MSSLFEKTKNQIIPKQLNQPAFFAEPTRACAAHLHATSSVYKPLDNTEASRLNSLAQPPFSPLASLLSPPPPAVSRVDENSTLSAAVSHLRYAPPLYTFAILTYVLPLHISARHSMLHSAALLSPFRSKSTPPVM